MTGWRCACVALFAVMLALGCEAGPQNGGDPGPRDLPGSDNTATDAPLLDFSGPDVPLPADPGTDWGDVPVQRIVALKVWQPVASPGDVVDFTGLGFHPDPARNVFRFAGGATVAPLSVEPCPYTDYTNQQLVRVAIPEAALTGDVAARQSDGGDWSDPVPMTIRPAAVITLAPGWEAGGLYLPGYDVGQPDPWIMSSDEPWINCAMGAGTEIWNWCWLVDVNWVLAGSGFEALRQDHSWHLADGIRLIATLPDGATADWKGFARDDGHVVFETSQHPLRKVFPGDVVALRVEGVEKDGYHLRRSNTIELPFTLLMRLGATRLLRLPAMESDPAEGMMDMSAGDILIVRGDAQARVVTAPGLWEGPIEFVCPYDNDFSAPPVPQGGQHVRLCARHFVIPAPGEYVVTDATTGRARMIRVPARGVVGGSAVVSGDRVAQEGAILGFGGGRLVVPPGALPLHDGGGRYEVSTYHAPQEKASWDPDATDNGSVFRLRFWPEPDELLQPITITLPFDPAGYAGTPTLGVQDFESGLFWDLGGTIDAIASTLTITLPAGTYADANGPAGAPLWWTAGVPAAPIASPGTTAPPPGRLNALLGALVAWGARSTRGLEVDTARKLQVDYVTDPASSSYASPATAASVLATAVATYDHLKGLGWTVPDGIVTLHLRDMGNPNDIKGSTTKGVFGQPWVTINSRLSGVAMDTTVAHEMGHVFQRQLTTNLIAHWFDEAAAQWVAVDALGSGANIDADITGAADFPTTSLPTTFQFGYDTDQGYAAGALAIWLERQSAGCLLKVYQALAGNPTKWFDAHAVLKSECGKGPSDIATEFGLDYWGQTYPPVDALAIGGNPQTWADWPGLTLPLALPGYASTRIDVRFDPAFLPSLAGGPFVARVTGPAPPELIILGDMAPATAPVGASAARLANVLPGTAYALLGDAWIYTSLRVIAIQAGSDAASGTLRLVVPHVETLIPATGKPGGGYTVTVHGVGFGNAKGKVYVGGFPQDPLGVTTWNDTTVIFTMFNAGNAQGEWGVHVEVAEGVSTNAKPFTFVP